DAEIQRRAELGALPPGQVGAPDFAAAARRYLAVVERDHVNPRGPRRGLALMVARWGTRPLESLTVADVEAYRTWRATVPALRRRPRRADGDPPAAPVSGATVNRELATLSAFFGWCQEQGWLRDGHNPARARSRRRRGLGVARFEEPWRPWQTLPPARQAAFLAAFPEAERQRVELLLELGVRLAVVLALDWHQLDLEAELLAYTSKRRSVVVPLSPRAVAILRALGPRPAGPVFPTRSDTAIRRAWPQACAAAGLGADFRRHDLRVTRARRLADEGAHLKTIAALPGHATLAMAARYVPVDLDTQRAAVARSAQASAQAPGTPRRYRRSRLRPDDS